MMPCAFFESCDPEEQAFMLKCHGSPDCCACNENDECYGSLDGR